MLYVLLALLFGPAPQSISLTVTSTSERNAPLLLAVYACEESFANERPLLGFQEPMLTGKANFSLELPGSGEYVFAAFQDINNNGVLDRNLMGVPTEPYGFGAAPPSKWREPAFNEVSTRIKLGEAATATIHLKTWKEY